MTVFRDHYGTNVRYLFIAPLDLEVWKRCVYEDDEPYFLWNCQEAQVRSGKVEKTFVTENIFVRIFTAQAYRQRLAQIRRLFRSRKTVPSHLLQALHHFFVDATYAPIYICEGPTWGTGPTWGKPKFVAVPAKQMNFFSMAMRRIVGLLCLVGSIKQDH